jgi:hypothetical protein
MVSFPTLAPTYRASQKIRDDRSRREVQRKLLSITDPILGGMITSTVHSFLSQIIEQGSRMTPNHVKQTTPWPGGIQTRFSPQPRPCCSGHSTQAPRGFAESWNRSHPRLCVRLGKPIWGQAILRRYIRPAASRAGIAETIRMAHVSAHLDVSA